MANIGTRGVRGAFLLAGTAVLATLAMATAPAAAQQCVGDCNADGAVAVNELVLAVNIVLGNSPLTTCQAILDPPSTTGTPMVNDVVKAVNNLLNGCPAVACVPPEGGRCVEIAPGENAQDEILTALLEAQPKDVIFLKKGTYALTGQLSLSVNDVTIRGEGSDETVLSFADQASAGESLLVQADRFTIEDIALVDGPGDLIKVLGGDGVTVRRVRTEWTNGAATDNGAYGIYPVQCRDVLIEDSFVRGASDAGIYVGQSRSIIVRNNIVTENVAGIEIENSTDADVHGNTATHNTGGILVFNLPGPPIQDGRRTRLHDNQIVENNTPNFAPPGNTVAAVPTGTGVMIMANDQVEVFENIFTDNDTTHIILISYRTGELFGASPANNPAHDAYSESIFIHDNTFTGGGTNPPEGLALVVTINGGLPMPNILYDGDVNAERLVEGQLPAELRTCIQQPGATYLNLDAGHQFANPSKDLSRVDCTLDRLSPPVLEGRHIEIGPGANAQDEILTALLEAQPGDDILLKAGSYDFTEALSLTVDHVTLRGEGIDETVLRFGDLSTGGEGLLVQADDFTLQDIAFEDAPGDQVKVLGCDGLRVQRVRTEWTNGPATDNGAYGIYPVQCKDVLIEDSVVKGASDAGVYVGQSRNIIVRRNHVEDNVAGIEIENSTNADVHDNMATGNTGGILVFNLPGLPVYGRATRLYDNQVIANNEPNFAPEGNTVASVPAGTGIFILANDEVEVFNNQLTDNNTNQITVISFNTAQFFGLPPPTDPLFDPFSESIYILDNSYEGGGTDPDLGELEDALVGLVGGLPVPNIVYDGDEDPDKKVDDALPAALRTCVQDADATFVNLNIPSIIAQDPMVSKDKGPFDCALTRLAPVAIPGVR